MVSREREVTSARTPPPRFAPAPKPRHMLLHDVDFATENILDLRALWTAKRPGRTMLPAWTFFDPLETVSYTHLTLPTIYSV